MQDWSMYRAGAGLAGALGRRGRGALKKSNPGARGGAKKSGALIFHKINCFADSKPDSLLTIPSLCSPNDQNFDYVEHKNGI
jgi:hypothetical protein